MVTAETSPMHQCRYNLFMLKLVSGKSPVLLIEKFPFLVLARNTLMLQHLLVLLIHYSLHYLSGGLLREVKNKRKFLTFISTIGRDRLRDAVAYKRF